MRRAVPAVRILPMSDQVDGFHVRSGEQFQRDVFFRSLPARNGRWRYRNAGLSADPGTVVLFPFKARVIAGAVFLRDEPFERPIRGSAGGVNGWPPTRLRPSP